MPKKFGVNSKSAEAREREQTKKVEKREQEARQKEDSYWNGLESQDRAKRDEKKEEEARKKAEAERRRREAKELEAKEAAELEKANKAKAGKDPLRPKITAFQIAQMKEREKAEAEKAKANDPKIVREDEYARQVEAPNNNRAGDTIEASGLDEALRELEAALPSAGSSSAATISWKEFYAQTLPRVRAENPSMVFTQHQQMVWEMWKKSPLNPKNRPQE
eukprot:tig00000269_g23728.t1